MKTKNKIIISTLCLSLTGCGAIMNATKYKNWNYVRLESQVPSPSCVYKIQESCSKPLNQCMDWHKKHAVTFGADTVVITNSDKQNQYSTGMWAVRGAENTSTIADYYYCNGAKNIKSL